MPKTPEDELIDALRKINRALDRLGITPVVTVDEASTMPPEYLRIMVEVTRRRLTTATVALRGITT